MKKVTENNTNRILNIWKKIMETVDYVCRSSTEAHLICYDKFQNPHKTDKILY